MSPHLSEYKQCTYLNQVSAALHCGQPWGTSGYLSKYNRPADPCVTATVAFQEQSMVSRAPDQSAPSGNVSLQCDFEVDSQFFFFPHNVHYNTTLPPCWEVMSRLREIKLLLV